MSAVCMDLPYAYVDSIAKMIPNELGITIEKALQKNPELRRLYETDTQGERADRYDQSVLEGSAEPYIHACGWCRDLGRSRWTSMCRSPVVRTA